MSALRELQPALDATEIVSPTALRFAGQPYERPAATPAEAVAARQAGAVIVPLLSEVLYGQAYVRRFGTPPAPPPTPGPGDDLSAVLSAAHPGRDRWEDGWEARQTLSTGRVVAARNAVTTLFPRLSGDHLAVDGRTLAGSVNGRPRSPATCSDNSAPSCVDKPLASAASAAHAACQPLSASFRTYGSVELVSA